MKAVMDHKYHTVLLCYLLTIMSHIQVQFNITITETYKVRQVHTVSRKPDLINFQIKMAGNDNIFLAHKLSKSLQCSSIQLAKFDKTG